MSNLYVLFARVCGGLAIVATAGVFGIQGIGRDELILVGLGVSAGWLRFRLAPAGHLTLSPTAFFLALLMVEPWAAFAVAVASHVLSGLLFARDPLPEIFRVSGEEALPTLGATLASSALSSLPLGALSGETLLAFSTAVGSYVALKLITGALGGQLTEGISWRIYLSGVTKNSAANLLFLASVALGLRVSLYGQFGYLALILVTIALVEFYHPWKLLSEQDEILFANLAMIAQAIDIKDPYTARHSKNVAEVAVRVARTMGLPEEEVRKIRIGALMHDIGKIGVSTGIIRKPSKLDSDEERAMRAHPVISADIMQPIELLADAAEIVRHHHEHCDGTGYPSGLKVAQIPIGSRVILVADAFDAMITDRPYRRGRSKEEALGVLRDHAGRQFDPNVVRALEMILPHL